MHHLFLHVRDGEAFIEDPEGGNFPDIAAAHAEAIASLQEIVADRLEAGKKPGSLQVEICDDRGHLLATISSKAVLH
jgi:hypothetical protein